jgi:hypothetical protein
MRSRWLAVGLVALVGTGTLALVAAAQVVNKARVGVRGRIETRGYSRSLYVVFTSPEDYAAGCCTDADSGEWNGPRYQASGNRSLGGTSRIGWRAVFERGPSSAAAAAHAGLVHPWPQTGTATIPVRHTTAGKTVGKLPGAVVFTHAPETATAQTEGALAFPLCPGLFAVADFITLEPSTDSTGGVAGEYQVDGMLASAWNDRQLGFAIVGVSLDGYLKIGKLSAVAKKGIVTGRLTDCRGAPMPGATIKAGRTTAKTNAAGNYRLREPRGPAKTFLLTATAGGQTASRRVSK